MAEFDRDATVMEILGDMGVGDLNDVTGLRVTGGDREELLEEVRHLLRDAYGNGMGGDGADVWADANIIPDADDELLRYFTAVEAAHEVTLGDLGCSSHASTLHVVAAALDRVYSDGVSALVRHLEEHADQRENDHEDEDEEPEDAEPGKAAASDVDSDWL